MRADHRYNQGGMVTPYGVPPGTLKYLPGELLSAGAAIDGNALPFAATAAVGGAA